MLPRGSLLRGLRLHCRLPLLRAGVAARALPFRLGGAGGDGVDAIEIATLLLHLQLYRLQELQNRVQRRLRRPGVGLDAAANEEALNQGAGGYISNFRYLDRQKRRKRVCDTCAGTVAARGMPGVTRKGQGHRRKQWKMVSTWSTAVRCRPQSGSHGLQGLVPGVRPLKKLSSKNNKIEMSIKMRKFGGMIKKVLLLF
jgi:hypothetical protein